MPEGNRNGERTRAADHSVPVRVADNPWVRVFSSVGTTLVAGVILFFVTLMFNDFRAVKVEITDALRSIAVMQQQVIDHDRRLGGVERCCYRNRGYREDSSAGVPIPFRWTRSNGETEGAEE